uniref:Uncharacterized protein n=1 Tax=Lactuca sativa TaxID=4236 RepID=A0A9R1WKI4_LACSA|nr:hypothetical protein LSAT_V11C100034730 [Lactuca sativa]
MYNGVSTRNRKFPRNDDGGGDEQSNDDDNETLDIFSYPSRNYIFWGCGSYELVAEVENNFASWFQNYVVLDKVSKSITYLVHT